MGQFPKLVGDRYPTSRYSVFAVKSVSGQICGQKFFVETHGGGKTRKREKNGDFASFQCSPCEAVTRSQSRRATNCATPRLRFSHSNYSIVFAVGQVEKCTLCANRQERCTGIDKEAFFMIK